jgi:hypothetical protein
MLERPAWNQAARERKARYKRRQRAGRIVVPVEIGETVIDGLVAIGWLPERDATNARRIGNAVAEMLADTFK